MRVLRVQIQGTTGLWTSVDHSSDSGDGILMQ